MAAMWYAPADALNQADVYQELAALGAHVPRRQGRHVTNCPLGTHSDSSPSFTIYLDGTWFCFGCHEYGDALNRRWLRTEGALRRKRA